MVAITVRPTGTVVAKETAVHVKAVDVVENETNGDPRVHYLEASASGEPTLRSQVFSGDGEWEGGLIFPSAGSWALGLFKEDGSAVTTLSGGITAV